MMPQHRRIAIALQIDEPHPHHQDVYAGILHYAQENPEWVCYIDEHPGTGPSRMLAGENVYDGVIARASLEMLGRLKRLGIPMVNTHFQIHRRGIAGVYPDPDYNGKTAAEHLISIGMPRLHFITDEIHTFSVSLGKAFTRQAELEGIPCTVSYFKEPAYCNKKAWIKMKTELLRCIESMEPPIGVYVSTAPLARVLTQLAQANGWRVPRDMAVLCGRDLRSIVEVSPTISTLEVNYKRIGYMAAQLLDTMIDGSQTSTQLVLISQATLIARESTDYRVVDDEVVSQALRYISQNLQAPLRIDTIAFELNISPRLLQQRFAEKLGTGVSEEIRRLRLEKAKRLLTEPDRLINSIPKAVGFASSNVLNKIFKRELGMTPSKYRSQILDDKPYRS